MKLLIASYMNYLVTNHGAIVPQYVDENDQLAVRRSRRSTTRSGARASTSAWAGPSPSRSSTVAATSTASPSRSPLPRLPCDRRPGSHRGGAPLIGLRSKSLGCKPVGTWVRTQGVHGQSRYLVAFIVAPSVRSPFHRRRRAAARPSGGSTMSESLEMTGNGGVRWRPRARGPARFEAVYKVQLYRVHGHARPDRHGRHRGRHHGLVGAHGLACVSIIMSIELLNVAFGSALAVGVSTVAGNRLGAGGSRGASHAFSQGFPLQARFVVVIVAIADLYAAARRIPGRYPRHHGGHHRRQPHVPALAAVLHRLRDAVRYVADRREAARGGFLPDSVGSRIDRLAGDFDIRARSRRGRCGRTTDVGRNWAIDQVFHRRGALGLCIRLAGHPSLEPVLCLQIIRVGMPLFLLQAASAVYTTVVNNEAPAVGPASISRLSRSSTAISSTSSS